LSAYAADVAGTTAASRDGKSRPSGDPDESEHPQKRPKFDGLKPLHFTPVAYIERSIDDDAEGVPTKDGEDVKEEKVGSSEPVSHPFGSWATISRPAPKAAEEDARQETEQKQTTHSLLDGDEDPEDLRNFRIGVKSTADVLSNRADGEPGADDVGQDTEAAHAMFKKGKSKARNARQRM
jgi:hypothetical protein